MLITNVLVAGSVAYAGVKTLIDARQPKSVKATQTGLAEADKRPDGTVTTKLEATQAMLRNATLQERRNVALANTAFWLSIGGWFLPPLTIASIPLTIYTTVPILEAATQGLFLEGRMKPSVINSILLVSTLLSEHYTTAALISTLHHTFRQMGRRLQVVGEQMTTEVNQEVGDWVRQAMGGTPREVWVVSTTDDSNTVEMKIPFTDLKVGDTLVVNRGEFIPIDGVITAGDAKLNLLLLTRSPTPVAVSVGDKVYTMSFVIEGRIRIQVENIRVQTPDN
ncbi:MAG: hypothetical protein U0350_47500 [Caldilineaceae bacterium]